MTPSPTPSPSYPYEYDPEKRRQAKAYSRIKLLTGMVNGLLIPVISLLALFFTGASFTLKAALAGFGIAQVPLFILTVLLLLTAVTFPLAFHSGYAFEHRYRLSRHTRRSWFKDYLKSVAVGYVFAVPVLTAVYVLMGLAHWWAYAVVLYFAVGVLTDTVYPILILPLFYKLSPFQNQPLKRRLLEMAQAAGSKNVRDVLVAKESEKSVKANALFTGFGRTKRIVLFDTLFSEFTDDEVETVIGHELGHYVHKDLWRGIVLNTALLFPVFYGIHLLLTAAPGLEGIGDIAGLPLFLVAFDLLEFLLLPVTNTFSRRMERQADLFGLEASGKPEAQISTERRLADQALADNSPHPLVELWLHSHPAPDKRVAMVKEWQTNRS